uniref:gibberellin 2beta-dioxygenase n=1 Tax=Paris polyphylla var. yunnanensis TaxID=221260 RepID=A0A2P1NRE5_PARPY|nr:GA2ox2 [Paris polyphylla var. yunnanensis]
MVVASPMPGCNERVLGLGIPLIDLSWRRERASKLIVKASEKFGFFRVINHGVPKGVVARMEAEAIEFFSMSAQEKQNSGPPSPLGYGIRNIGLKGDTGELEYLILHANPTSVAPWARTVCRKDPMKFSSIVNEYVEGTRGLACDILEMMGEELRLDDRRALSKLIRDDENDSLIRFNHYGPHCCSSNKNGKSPRIGFGEHSDPQILSILRSNGVEGLQILMSSDDGDVWIPVPADPDAFFVIVGDVLQALTNGRLLSVRHRAMSNSNCSRLSMIYFGAPTLHTMISPLPEMVSLETPCRYRSFTWADYKKAMYSLRLTHNRLDLFLINIAQDISPFERILQIL